MNKNIKRLCVALLLLAVLSVWAWWGNTALQLNTHVVTSPRLPQSFNGYRIAQVSDLHNAQMGADNSRLLAVLRQAQPDIIVLTGDLVDSRNTDVATALRFAEQAVQIAPCYYVSGNHEARLDGGYTALTDGLTALGVTVLDGEQILLTRGGESIVLLGVGDPSFHTDYLFGDAAAVVTRQLQQLTGGTSAQYTVLLSHRPELFKVYAACGIDLVFSGHAHGGQFRIPGVGGLVAPNQGFFPAYDAGAYTEGNTTMLVSRGVGNSMIPLRINNQPEVVLAELRCP